MTVLGLILLLVWGYSVVSILWEFYMDTLEEFELRFGISVVGFITIIVYGFAEGWFDFLSYKIF